MYSSNSFSLILLVSEYINICTKTAFSVNFLDRLKCKIGVNGYKYRLESLRDKKCWLDVLEKENENMPQVESQLFVTNKYDEKLNRLISHLNDIATILDDVVYPQSVKEIQLENKKEEIKNFLDDDSSFESMATHYCEDLFYEFQELENKRITKKSLYSILSFLVTCNKTNYSNLSSYIDEVDEILSEIS